MAWPRIKNIVILILALVNLFLLVLVVSREGSDARQKAEALTSAVHILEQGGITVDESGLPREAGLTPCRVEQSRSGEEALAQALLGDVTGEERGGGVFRYTAADGTRRTISTDTEMAMYLLEEAHVATVAGSAFFLPGYIRLSYAAAEEQLTAAMARISDALARLK